MIVSSDLWILFFKRIKNNNNLYILREKKYPFIHRFWCVFHRTKNINFNELNPKCKFKQKSLNVYSILSSNTDYRKDFNVVIFYYINKLALISYPYFYWTYLHLYNKYENTSNVSTQSRSNKEMVFFTSLKSIKEFTLENKNISFVKTSLNSFRGVRTTLKNIENVSSISLLPKLKLLQDDVKEPLIANENLFERDALKNYSVFFKSNALNLKFYLNTVIYNNTELFIKHYNNNTRLVANYLTVFWYNKVHNSIIDTTTNNIIMYLRAARHFNKGRYSRNRQIYRTGVYWCIWLNVVIVYALHYYFYRVVFSFGYLWLPLALMILVMFSSRLYKYRYYDINQILVEFKEFNNFVYYNTVYFNNKYNSVLQNLNKNLSKFFKNYSQLFNSAVVSYFK